MTIRFDDAWRNAVSHATSLAESGADVMLVRDLLGRITALIDSSEEVGDQSREEFASLLGRFASQNPVISTSQLVSPEDLLEAPDVRVLKVRTGSTGQLSILQRSVAGSEWRRPRISSDRNRVAMYGFKGGVGRSTATVVLARHLATLGKCVLVADLDLESPGVGGLIAGTSIPDAPHGISDYLIESAVGNQDGLHLVERVPLDVEGNGEIWLAPAEGQISEDRDYAAKLNRIYSDLPGGQTFGNRLDAALTEAEAQVAAASRAPDVVLLDSRAGIHDIAAVAVTQLARTSLLFATNNPHTWHGYRTLFKQWRDGLPGSQLDALRRSLKMVASMVPTTESSAYLNRFRDSAQSCFAAYLYDESTDGGDMDAFNFSPADIDAPHSPLPILFSSDLVGLDSRQSTGWHEQPFVKTAYRDFLRDTTELIEGVSGEIEGV